MTNNSEKPQAPLSPRILVAEDSPLNLQVALRQLEKLGFPADGVTDGAKVLEAVRRIPYDIILMDCQMPELNGYEATWQIRHQEKEPSRGARISPKAIYIIAMTANARADSREKCLQAGMNDYVSKPVELRELEAALRRGLFRCASADGIDRIIDPVIIAGIRQLRMPGKPDPLVELIDLFLQETPGQVQALAAAVTQSNDTSLSRVFSALAALKGSAINLGARKVAALCDEIEQSARDWSQPELQRLIERVQEELKRASDALQIIRERASAESSRPIS